MTIIKIEDGKLLISEIGENLNTILEFDDINTAMNRVQNAA